VRAVAIPGLTEEWTQWFKVAGGGALLLVIRYLRAHYRPTPAIKSNGNGEAWSAASKVIEGGQERLIKLYDREVADHLETEKQLRAEQEENFKFRAELLELRATVKDQAKQIVLLEKRIAQLEAQKNEKLS
jgi:hypothetical protein